SGALAIGHAADVDQPGDVDRHARQHLLPGIRRSLGAEGHGRAGGQDADALEVGMMRTLPRLACAAALFALCASGAVAAQSDPLNVALRDSARPPLEMARDTARKPEAVVAFAGVKPGQAIVDFVPGDGYYTRILSKLAGPKGRIYALVPAWV